MGNLIHKDVVYTLINLREENETDGLIARVLIDHISQIGKLKNKELAELCHCDSATITRFIQKLGFTTYSEFKKWFIQFNHDDVVEVQNYSLDQVMDDHILSLNETRKLLDEKLIDRVVDEIYDQDHIVVAGGRYSHLAAQDMQMRFLSENKVMTTFVDESELLTYIPQHPSGLFILFSASQSHPIVEEMLLLARNNHYKIVIISHVVSELADITLEIPFNERKWTYNSQEDRYCMLAVVDSIYLKYRQKLHNLQENK